MSSGNLCEIEARLCSKQWEVARRLCLRELKREPDLRVSLLLHEAYRCLGDVPGQLKTLEEAAPANDDERFEVLLLQALDAEQLAKGAGDYYRISPEMNAGLSKDEFLETWAGRARRLWSETRSKANTEARREAIGKARAAIEPEPGGEERSRAMVLPAKALPAKYGSVAGRLIFPDGSPVIDAEVTLGLQMEVQPFDPDTFAGAGYGIEMHLSAQESLRTRTDAHGAFDFPQVPEGLHEFLAVTLDLARFDISTRFFAQYFSVAENARTELNGTIDEWTSAPSHLVENPFPQRMTRGAVHYRRVGEVKLHNPFHYAFPRQDLRIPLPEDAAADPAKLLLLCSTEPSMPRPFQLIGPEVLFFAELPPLSERVYALYAAEEPAAEPFAQGQPLFSPPAEGTAEAVIDTGRTSFRIPFGEGSDALPPILSVRGEDGIWRGRGRFVLPGGIRIVSRKTEVLENGPLAVEWQTHYALSNGADYLFKFTAHQGEPYLLAHEVSCDVEGMAFEFSLKEWSGGRGYLHWTSLPHGLRWSTLQAEDRELARLQESVPWWIPPAGFGYGMTPEGLGETDFIGVFTIRRGDWIDRKFEQLTHGPVNRDGTRNDELDWPFPDMVGSTVSMITARTSADGDAFFRFGAFDGERRWGLLVSTLDRNDGNGKEIASVQHKVSSPRLQDFKDWSLDEPDRGLRPCTVVRRADLCSLRGKQEKPEFGRLWERIRQGNPWESEEALVFAIEGDPVTAWRKKKELLTVAPLRARMVLQGRDASGIYSPVGGRLITTFAQEYDLLAPSGIFTPGEERLLRAYFILMGHMFMEPDLMNWRFGSRNCNFEADRVEVVGTVGLVFRGHPDSEKFLTHCIALTQQALKVYCTPESGRWYENPSCYYLSALKCRVALSFHLAAEGLIDLAQIERLKEFLSWGVLLMTPPYPHSSDLMRNGCAGEEYRRAERVRRIPPIGDHAYLGAWMPDQLALMAQKFRPFDPSFANFLLWAWQAGGSDGGYFGNPSLIFGHLSGADLLPAPAHDLTSRRLEGFGAVFRGGFNTEKEFYLLLKQGPGGYRYHRTEGSIILFADGKPLIFDGGEAGETWRHTTLSFYDVHMPLAPGHVERFHSFAEIDFCQGVHPTVIAPGSPIQLNDACDHHLVQTAWERFEEKAPADVRSVIWIKDEYIILHDDLRLDAAIASHWNAQIVADAETGNATDGYVFKGRFGTDLQVVLPDQKFTAERCGALPIYDYDRPKEESFSMRHLQLTGDCPDHYLALLRPLSIGKSEVKAHQLHLEKKTCGLRVEGDGIDDMIFLAREPMVFARPGVTFNGRYGAVLRRGNKTTLALIAGSVLEADGVRITSDGPAASLTIKDATWEIDLEGDGTVGISMAGMTRSYRVSGRRTFLVALPIE